MTPSSGVLHRGALRWADKMPEPCRCGQAAGSPATVRGAARTGGWGKVAAAGNGAWRQVPERAATRRAATTAMALSEKGWIGGTAFPCQRRQAAILGRCSAPGADEFRDGVLKFAELIACAHRAGSPARSPGSGFRASSSACIARQRSGARSWRGCARAASRSNSAGGVRWRSGAWRLMPWSRMSSRRLAGVDGSRMRVFCTGERGRVGRRSGEVHVDKAIVGAERRGVDRVEVEGPASAVDRPDAPRLSPADAGRQPAGDVRASTDRHAGRSRRLRGHRTQSRVARRHPGIGDVRGGAGDCLATDGGVAAQATLGPASADALSEPLPGC